MVERQDYKAKAQDAFQAEVKKLAAHSGLTEVQLSDALSELAEDYEMIAAYNSDDDTEEELDFINGKTSKPE